MPGGRPRSVDLDALERLYRAAAAAGEPTTAAAMAAALEAATGRPVARSTAATALIKLTDEGRIERRVDGRRRNSYMSQLRRNARYPLAPGQDTGYLATLLSKLSSIDAKEPVGKSDSSADMASAAVGLAARMRNKNNPRVFDINLVGVIYLRPAESWEVGSLVVQPRPDGGGQAVEGPRGG